MKKLFPFVLLCLTLLSLGLSACSDKDDNVPRIQLAYENPNEVFDNENPCISLRAFETTDRVYLIQGGDGNFRLEVNNDKVVQVRCEGSKLFIRPLKAGKAEVLIRDGYGWDYLLSVTVGYPYYLYGVIDNRVMLQGAGLTDEEKSALEQEMLQASSGPAVVKGYTLVYQNEAMNAGQLVIGSSRYVFDASAEPIGLEDPLELNVRTADGFARKFFFERFTPVRLSSGNRSDELFLSESNGGISPDTRDLNSAPYFRCVVADRTSLYRERYPALEHAYHVQVVIEQYEGLTSEE